MSAVHMIPGGNWIKHEQWNLEMLLLVIRNHMLATVKVFYTKKMSTVLLGRVTI